MNAHRITVNPYDETWPARFAEIRDYLLPTLQGKIVTIEHVGSTSVPGLAAKPIIDLDVVIPDQPAFGPVKAALEDLGYSHNGDQGIPGREAFKYAGKPGLAPHHLYVCVQGSAELRRHLALRDWLSTHPGDRERYAAAKFEAAALFPEHIDAYIDAKSEVIQHIYACCGLLPATAEDRARGLLANRYGLRVTRLEVITSDQAGITAEVSADGGSFLLRVNHKPLHSSPPSNLPGLRVSTCSGREMVEDDLAVYILYK